MSIAENIKQLRATHKLTQVELGQIAGVTDKAVSTWEAGIKEPRMGAVRRIADHFGMTIEELIDSPPSNNIVPFSEPLGEIVPFPILASVAAGYNGLAREEYTDEVEALPRSFLRGYDPSELRVLRISGNSMYPRFLDGDRVLVHLQPVVDDGEIAVVFYNGDEATVKQVYCKPNAVELVPFNPEYPPRRIEGVDLEQFQIFGKVIKLIRDV